MPAWSRFIDKDQMFGFGVKLAHELVNIGLPATNSAEEYDFSVVSFGPGSNSNGILMHGHSDFERARL